MIHVGHSKTMYACGEHVMTQCRCPGPKDTHVSNVPCPNKECQEKFVAVQHPDLKVTRG